MRSNGSWSFMSLTSSSASSARILAKAGEWRKAQITRRGSCPAALSVPLPSFQPFDLMIGIICGILLRIAVYLRAKDAKKFRHNVEYGSARWGTKKDIAPFEDPVFRNNIILTKTEY